MIYLVTGLPGSGKTTYVKEHMKDNDCVYDFDYLCAAFSYCDIHGERNRNIKEMVNDLLIPLIHNHQSYGIDDLYIIRTSPSERELSEIDNVIEHLIILDTNEDVCAERMIKRDGKIIEGYEQIILKHEQFRRNISMIKWESIVVIPPLKPNLKGY